MAVYKVIQNVEAEDKLVGFLTLKTFIYAIIAASLAYINFRFAIAGSLGPVRWVFVLIFIFPMFLFGVLAAPLGRDQPTEVWILSHIKFLIKPRKKVWDQSGMQELVTITAPKQIDRHLTKELTQREVRSRLRALATTLDSRGWAVKNVAVDLGAQPGYFDTANANDERLVNPTNTAQPLIATDVQAADDIMDAQNNPLAQHFDTLMKQADAERKKDIVQKMNTSVSQAQAVAPNGDVDLEFLDKAPAQGPTTFVGRRIVAPNSQDADNFYDENGDEIDKNVVANLTDEEKALLDRIHKKEDEVHKGAVTFEPSNAKSKVQKNPSLPKAKKQKKAPEEAQELQAEISIEKNQDTGGSRSGQTPQLPIQSTQTVPIDQQQPVTPPAQAAKLKELSKSGNDITVASVQKLADQVTKISDNEVEIKIQHKPK